MRIQSLKIKQLHERYFPFPLKTRRPERSEGSPSGEDVAIYLYGVIEGYRTIGAIHRYAQRHLTAWFPHLPGYKAFDYRINQLHDVFAPFVHLLCDKMIARQQTEQLTGLTDSMPIIMAQRGRRFHAKVAPEIATKNGYCATKKLYYYGVKLHVIASKVRSYQGLIVHVFGKMTAALFIMQQRLRLMETPRCARGDVLSGGKENTAHATA